MSSQYSKKPSMPEMVLGGAQLGLAYGVSNESKVPIERQEAQKILSLAYQEGITAIDTASAYGESETRIGEILHANRAIHFKLVSKTSPCTQATSIDAEVLSKVDRAFDASLKKLAKKNIDTLLVHHAEDLLKPGGERLYDWLLQCKERGLVNKIGCSFYTRAQLEGVLSQFSLEAIQVPANIFDQRMFCDNYLHELSAKTDVYVRSVFLQGLIFLEEAQLPQNIQHAASFFLGRFRALAEDLSFTPIELALAFFKNKPWLRLVIGVTSSHELLEIVRAKNKVEHTDFSEINFDELSVTDPVMLNPGAWDKK